VHVATSLVAGTGLSLVELRPASLLFVRQAGAQR
jgi:hypothetical protein